MYDPRSTGGSEGDRISYGYLEARDLVGAFEWLERRGFESQRVAVLGWSMGCATAMCALRERTYAGLIADSGLGGFVVDDVVKYVSVVFKVPRGASKILVTCFMRSVFLTARVLWGMRLGDQPLEHLRANPIPTVVIHGTADKQVPVRTGEEVARAAGDRLLAAHYLEGLDHMDAVFRDREWYMTTVLGALEQMFNQQDKRAPAAQLRV